MSQEMLQSIFRNLLRVAIGALVTAGYIKPGIITDQTTVEIGGAIAFVLLEWWTHRNKTAIKETAAIAAIVETKQSILQSTVQETKGTK